MRLDTSRRVLIAGAAVVVGGTAACALWLAFRGGGTTVSEWSLSALLIAVGGAVLAVGGALGAPPRRHWPGWYGIAGAAALTVFSAASVAWSPSPTLTLNATGFWALTVAVLALVAWCCRGCGRALMGITSVVATSTAVAIAVEVRLLQGEEDLFRFERLSWPIEYANGAGALVLIGVPAAIGLSIALPAPAPVKAVFAGTAGFLLAVGVLAESRGSAIAIVVAAVVVVAMAASRVVAILTLVAVGAGPGVVIQSLVLSEDLRPERTGGDVLVAAAVSAVCGLAVAIFGDRIALGQWIRPVLALATALAIVASGALFLSRVGEPTAVASRLWEQFSRPPAVSPPASQKHFASLQSNRYDYWRVALSEWRRSPAVGTGAGTFAIPWYRERRIRENVTDPHGWPFRIASEQGVFGLLFFSVLIGALLAAAAHVRRTHSIGRAAGVASAASTAYFFAHASVDWLMAIPPVLLLGLLSAGTLLAVSGDPSRALASFRVQGAAIVAAFCFLALAVSIWLSSRYLTLAEGETRSTVALAELREARRWNPWSIEPLQVEAEVRLDGGDLRGASRVLRSAVSREPERWEPWVQLAGVERLRGRERSWRAAYAQARRLNPLGLPP